MLVQCRRHRPEVAAPVTPDMVIAGLARQFSPLSWFRLDVEVSSCSEMCLLDVSWGKPSFRSRRCRLFQLDDLTPSSFSLRPPVPLPAMKYGLYLRNGIKAPQMSGT